MFIINNEINKHFKEGGNILKNVKLTEKEIKQLIRKEFDIFLILVELNKNNYRGFPYISIKYLNSWKTIKLPKKKIVNKEYILERVSKKINSSYKNFKKLFEKLDLSNGKIYYTSFGFSYNCLFEKYLNKNEFNKNIKKIKEKLDNLGIEYKNEFSNAGWVYRFKISQKRKNLKKIKKI